MDTAGVVVWSEFRPAAVPGRNTLKSSREWARRGIGTREYRTRQPVPVPCVAARTRFTRVKARTSYSPSSSGVHSRDFWRIFSNCCQ